MADELVKRRLGRASPTHRTDLLRQRLADRAGEIARNSTLAPARHTGAHHPGAAPLSPGGDGGAMAPAQDPAAVADRVRQRLVAHVPRDLLQSYHTSAQARQRVRLLLQEMVSEDAAALGVHGSADLMAYLEAELFGYGPIQPMVDDPDVSEILVNGPDRVWAEKGGKLAQVPVGFRDAEHLRQVAERIVTAVGRRVDESSPMADARLPDGSRVHVVLPPIALDGPYLTVRKFSRQFTAQDLVKMGTVSQDVLDLLAACVRGHLNIMVSGSTGAGKTVLLNVLSSFIGAGERVVTIEDAAELRLQQPHVVRMETRPPNVEGRGEVTIRELVRGALRMRPDRIIVGECRGGEALDMLQAMNTGHSGSMSTIHANGPGDALHRLGTLALMAGEDLPLRAVREQIASAVDLVVQVARFADGSRRLTAISQVGGVDPATGAVSCQDLYRFHYEGEDGGRVLGTLVATGAPLSPVLAGRMREYGITLPGGGAP